MCEWRCLWPVVYDIGMKIAAISDIHGNLGALDAVLADIERRGIDVIVNLGDILSGGLQPRETADRLMALDLPTIKGNHERQVLTGDPTRMGPSDRMTHALLRPDQRRWIESLPETLWLFDDVLLVHGTPGSDLTYFLEVVTESGCRLATKHEVACLAGTTDASLILCGHTHLPRTMQLDDGRLIVNPGSVGLQAYDDDRPFPHRMEMGSPHARYAIVERTTAGWSAELLSVAYDWDAAAVLAEMNGRMDWVHPLKTGLIKSADSA